MQVCFVVAAAWLTALCAADADAAAVPFIGTWYGEGQPDDPNVYWLARYDASGRFEADFRVCHGKQAEDQHDTGVWTYANNIDDVVTLSVNGVSSYYDDRYDTLSIDAHKFVYRHERTGFVFTAVKVEPNSALPSCAAVS